MSDGELTFLIASGAALEGLGLLLVALDLLRAGKRRAELTRPDQLVQVGGIASESSFGVPLVVTTGEQPPAPEPTLDERVAAVAGRIEDVARSLSDLEKRIEEDIRSASDSAAKMVAEARREIFDAFQRTRGLVGHEIGAHLWRRWIGVGVFFAGLVLNTLGNVWSL